VADWNAHNDAPFDALPENEQGRWLDAYRSGSLGKAALDRVEEGIRNRVAEAATRKTRLAQAGRAGPSSRKARQAAQEAWDDMAAAHEQATGRKALAFDERNEQEQSDWVATHHAPTLTAREKAEEATRLRNTHHLNRAIDKTSETVRNNLERDEEASRIPTARTRARNKTLRKEVPTLEPEEGADGERTVRPSNAVVDDAWDGAPVTVSEAAHDTALHNEVARLVPEFGKGGGVVINFDGKPVHLMDVDARSNGMAVLHSAVGSILRSRMGPIAQAYIARTAAHNVVFYTERRSVAGRVWYV